MELLGLNIEAKRPKNIVEPPKEMQTKEFTYVVTPATIINANISEYKSAFIAAHGKYIQQRTKIYDIYQNALDFDAHLVGLIKRRLLNTSGKVFQYVDSNGEPSEAVAEWISNNPTFTKLIDDILMVKFWGMGLFELYPDTEGSILDYTLIPIKHVDPFEKMVRREQSTVSNQSDVSWTGMDNVVFVGDGNDYGLLQQLALLAMYKRAAMGDWAQYSQLAGTNFRTVKYRGAQPDNKTRRNIRDIINSAGNGTIDLPNDIDVETSNQTSSSQNQLFENYIQYLDDQMTKLVLGQTMTTEDGSSRSQAEVHERTQDDIFDADGKYVLDLLNHKFDTALSGYGIEGGTWEFVESNTQQQMEEIERDLKLKELGVVFTNEEIREKYNLKTNNG